MSSRNELAVVSTLKPIVPPWLTLISVANPWMAELPAPSTSHSLAGDPGLLFSQTIGFCTGGSQAAAAACCCGGTTSTAAISAMASTIGRAKRMERCMERDISAPPPAGKSPHPPGE